MKELIKFAFVGGAFGVLAPLLGVFLKGRPTAQRVAFGLMCFMTINGLFAEANWGKTLLSIEWYRGHTKGFHFYFNHIFGIALLVAKTMESPKQMLKVPSGVPIYLMYCLCSSLSVFTAPEPLYVIMALHKMTFILVIFFATWHFLQKQEDLEFFLKVMAGTLMWEAFIVLKMKYLDGMYQVRGTFEHQNPLCMYAVMIGVVFLAVSMSTGKCTGRWTACGFAACGIIVQSTLSRAGMVVFAGGVVSVVALNLLERVTVRRAAFVFAFGFLGTVGLALTLDTIISRFGDEGNDASSELRHVLNEASRQMLQANPLGVGWNNYGLTINHPYPYANVVYAWLEDRGMPVDFDSPNALVESHYYLLLAENGYLGYGFYILFISQMLWLNLRSAVAFGPGLYRWVSIGIAAGCSLNYVQSLLERVLTQPRNLMLWMILLAITSRLNYWRKLKAKGLLPDLNKEPLTQPQTS